MNPPKSLMALGAAIVLAAPCVARADVAAGEWQALKTRPTYFVHLKTDGKDFAKMKAESYRGPLHLWMNEKRKDGTYVKVESGATLNCTYNRLKKWGCWIDVNAKDGGRYQIANVDIGQQVTTPPAPPPADQKPVGVSPEVWAEVVRSPKVKPAHWARAAKDVEEALKSPKAAKMRAAGLAGMEQLLASVEGGIDAKEDDSKIVQQAIDLSVKITAGAAPPPPGAPDAHGAPVQKDGKPVALGADENVVIALTQELAKPEVQADLAKRLFAFLTKPDDSSVYVDAKGHEETAAAQLQKAVDDGVAKLCATPPDRSRAAVLYFVLGEPGKQAWLADFKVLSLMAGPMKARDLFRKKMLPWTVAGAQTPGQADAGPYKGDANWPAQFLKDALVKADEAMNDKIADEDLKARIKKNGLSLNVPGDEGVGVGNGPVMPGNSDLRDLMARSFGADDMYRNGAYVRDVLIPGSKPPKYRTISMKIYAQQVKYGPPPVVEDRLGIFDITDVSPDGGRTPSNIFGQYFPLNQRGDSTFLLDDRDAKSIRYKLSMNGGGISFVPVGRDGKTPVGTAMTPSISDLYDARHDELTDNHQSYTATLNGQNFRIIPQGGPHGQLVYFAADSHGNVVSDQAVLTTDLSRINDHTGQTEALHGKQPLGYIGKDADGKDQFWYLVWNDKIQAYEAQAGDPPKGDPEDPMNPPPAKDSGKGKGVATSTSAATGDDNQVSGDTTTASDDDTNPNRDDATVTGGSEWACDSKKTFAKAPSFEEYRLHEAAGGAKWKLYTDGTAKALDTNQTYLCMYGGYGLWFEGLIPKKMPRRPDHNDQAIDLIGGHDGYLDVTVVKPAAATDGTKLIMPKDASNLIIGGSGDLAYGDNVQGHVDSAEEYIIPLKGLKAMMNQTNNITTAGHAAWIKLMPDFFQPNQNPLMLVYIHPGDDVKKVLSDAVRDHGGTSTVCKTDDTINPKLLSYFGTIAADPALAKALSDFKTQASDSNYANIQPPSVTLRCLSQETGGNVFDVATTSWGLSSGVLRSVKGKLVPGAVASNE